MKLVQYNASLRLEKPENSLNSYSIPKEWLDKPIVVSVNPFEEIYRFEIIRFYFSFTGGDAFPEIEKYTLYSFSKESGLSKLYALIN